MPTNPKPTSSKKSATARANGAKSLGPATAAGRARSSQNARRHGLATHTTTHAAASVVLPTESFEEFHALLNSYLADFAPAGLVETELVEAIVAARWRLRRIATIETTFLGNEIDRLAPYADKSFAAIHRVPTSDDRLAHAFNTLGNGASLNLLIRYEGTLSRSYARAFKQFQLLRSLRIRPQPNEPKQSLRSLPVEPTGDRVEASSDRAPTRSLPVEPFRRPGPIPPNKIDDKTLPAPPPVLQTPPQPLKFRPEPQQIPLPALQNSAPPAQRATMEFPPRINDQHLHS